MSWNAFLTYKINLLETPRDNQEPVINVVNKTVTGFSTDLTKIVEEAQSKVVGILAQRGNLVLGSSSGAIYKSDKKEVLILTNYAPLEVAANIKVIFDNGFQKEAELVGYDELMDLALLKVVTDFSVEPFTLADSSLQKAGEWALALGSARSNGNLSTVSVGVLSGPEKTRLVNLDGNPTQDWEMLLTQTDAIINQGNTGGPLINMEGELVGITSYQLSQNINAGVSTAIPSNELSLIVDQLLTKGEVSRIKLGLSTLDVQAMTVYQKSYLGINLDVLQGIYIQEIIPDSIALDSGLQVGDIILAIGDNKITNYRQYRRALYEKTPENGFEITILRDNAEMKVLVHFE